MLNCGDVVRRGFFTCAFCLVIEFEEEHSCLGSPLVSKAEENY